MFQCKMDKMVLIVRRRALLSSGFMCFCTHKDLFMKWNKVENVEGIYYTV